MPYPPGLGGLVPGFELALGVEIELFEKLRISGEFDDNSSLLRDLRTFALAWSF